MTAELDMAFGTPLGDAVGKLIVAAAHDQPAVLTAGEASALFDCVDRLRPLAAMLNGAAARKSEPATPDTPLAVAARLARSMARLARGSR